MWTRCLEPHCSPDGRSTKDWDAFATRSSCLADVYNLGGFLTRKRPSPNLTLAEAYYRTALAHQPHHCPTLGYLAELHLTTGNATAANATALELCAACGGGAALPARQARAAFEASGVAWPSRGACAPSTETVVFTLAASGSVSDYSDTSSLRQAVATAAGVDKSLVTIEVAAASVIITATIAVPASMSAAALKTSLSSSLGTAAAASAALGITVESDPTFTIVTEGDSETNSTVPIIGGVGEQRPFVIQHPLARRPYCHSTIRRVVPRHTLLILRRASCPAQHSWRRACALLLHRHRRRRLLLHEEEAARLHRRTRPSAERRGPVCTREQDLKTQGEPALATRSPCLSR